MNKNNASIALLAVLIFYTYVAINTNTYLVSKDTDSTILIGLIIALGGYLLNRLFDSQEEIKSKQPPDNNYWNKVNNCLKAVDANSETIELLAIEIKAITAELDYLEGLLSNGSVSQAQLLAFVQKIKSKKQLFEDRRKNPRLRFLVTKFVNMFEVLSKIHSENTALAITLEELKHGEANSNYFEEVKKVS